MDPNHPPAMAPTVRAVSLVKKQKSLQVSGQICIHGALEGCFGSQQHQSPCLLEVGRSRCSRNRTRVSWQDEQPNGWRKEARKGGEKRMKAALTF